MNVIDDSMCQRYVDDALRGYGDFVKHAPNSAAAQQDRDNAAVFDEAIEGSAADPWAGRTLSYRRQNVGTNLRFLSDAVRYLSCMNDQRTNDQHTFTIAGFLMAKNNRQDMTVPAGSAVDVRLASPRRHAQTAG